MQFANLQYRSDNQNNSLLFSLKNIEILSKMPGKLILAFSLLFLTFNAFSQQNLPKGLTEKEKGIFKDYIQNFEYGNKNTQPPALVPRTPAEFEEAGGVIITWTSYQAELREIVKHASQRVPVYIVADNATNVQAYLAQDGITMENITFVDFDFNSVWVRDFGPQSIYLSETDELAFVDWVYNRPRPQDNLIPFNMANFLDIPVFQMTSNPNRLVATGGNIMTDGHGTAFSSKLIVAENPNLSISEIDEIVYSYMGIDRYVKMNELPYDNISHIDMHMKLLDEETLLIGNFPEGVSDGPYIETNIAYVLNNYPTCYDRDFEIIRVPMVPNSSGNYPPYSHYRTFTNSIILNDLVLVPTYNNSALNQEALAIYEAAMPGYEIIGINMENVIGASGAIHCITKEIAAEDPIFISHAPFRTLDDFTGFYPVNAIIKNTTGITSASVFYKTTHNTDFTEISMMANGDSFSAEIPAQPCITTFEYYISATNKNKTVNKPLPGANGPWSIEINGDSVNFTASANQIEIDQPVTFSYTGCLENGNFENVNWNFGEGADPATHHNLNDVAVSYSTSGKKTISLTIDDVVVIRNNFISVSTKPTFALTVSTEGQGSTYPVSGIYRIDENKEVSISAEPAPGWLFEKWIINEDEITQTEVNLSITEDILAKAYFQQNITNIPRWEEKFLSDVFPNPAQKQFNVAMTPTPGNVFIAIYNLTGQKVQQHSIKVTQYDQIFSVDLSNEDSGVFFVKVTWEKGSHTHKILIQ